MKKIGKILESARRVRAARRAIIAFAFGGGSRCCSDPLCRVFGLEARRYGN